MYHPSKKLSIANSIGSVDTQTSTMFSEEFIIQKSYQERAYDTKYIDDMTGNTITGYAKL